MIGAQLAIYGALIGGIGIYELFVPLPPDDQTVLSNFHPGIWWGALMLIIGIFYVLKFHPKRKSPEE